MTYAEAIQFLYGLRWFGAKFGLENTLKLAALAGNPQDQLRFIHVAGTNGKGSTCAMLESIYRAAGLRVGLFTSPHLVSFRERIQVNRQLISEVDVVRLVAELLSERRSPDRLVEAALHRADQEIGAPIAGPDAHPTFFEFLTVMALRYFAEQKCDLVVWETGLGGRLDATNIVMPLASIITNIGLDHQQWLGDTLEKIATEKAGIIKSGVPVLTATDELEALHVIERAAREKRTALTRVSHASRITHHVSLLGDHQRLNAALAIAAVEALHRQMPVTDAQIRTGLSRVNWPGRMQLVERPPDRRVLLDGAHNAAGAATLRATLAECFPDARPAFILGVMQDKDRDAMCGTLAPLASRVLCVPVSSERSASPELLCDACRRVSPKTEVTAFASLAEAFRAVEAEPFVVVAGSLYLIGEAMELLHITSAPSSDEKALNEWTPKAMAGASLADTEAPTSPSL